METAKLISALPHSELLHRQLLLKGAENKVWNEMLKQYCTAKVQGKLSEIDAEDHQLATWVAEQHEWYDNEWITTAKINLLRKAGFPLKIHPEESPESWKMARKTATEKPPFRPNNRSHSKKGLTDKSTAAVAGVGTDHIVTETATAEHAGSEMPAIELQVTTPVVAAPEESPLLPIVDNATERLHSNNESYSDESSTKVPAISTAPARCAETSNTDPKSTSRTKFDDLVDTDHEDAVDSDHNDNSHNDDSTQRTGGVTTKNATATRAKKQSTKKKPKLGKKKTSKEKNPPVPSPDLARRHLPAPHRTIEASRKPTIEVSGKPPRKRGSLPGADQQPAKRTKTNSEEASATPKIWTTSIAAKMCNLVTYKIGNRNKMPEPVRASTFVNQLNKAIETTDEATRSNVHRVVAGLTAYLGHVLSSVEVQASDGKSIKKTLNGHDIALYLAVRPDLLSCEVDRHAESVIQNYEGSYVIRRNEELVEAYVKHLKDCEVGKNITIEEALNGDNDKLLIKVHMAAKKTMETSMVNLLGEKRALNYISYAWGNRGFKTQFVTKEKASKALVDQVRLYISLLDVFMKKRVEANKLGAESPQYYVIAPRNKEYIFSEKFGFDTLILYLAPCIRALLSMRATVAEAVNKREAPPSRVRHGLKTEEDVKQHLEAKRLWTNVKPGTLAWLTTLLFVSLDPIPPTSKPPVGKMSQKYIYFLRYFRARRATDKENKDVKCYPILYSQDMIEKYVERADSFATMYLQTDDKEFEIVDEHEFESRSIPSQIELESEESDKNNGSSSDKIKYVDSDSNGDTETSD